MNIWDDSPKRKAFSTRTKKTEWMLASGQRVFDSSGKRRFVKTSKCRECRRPLPWGSRTYDFDHKDNNPTNNSQTNCYLVCKICHGKHTVVKKRRRLGWFGETVGYETIKKKVGYKKTKKKPKKTKRVAVRDIFGNVTGYRTVKVRQVKSTKKKTTKKPRKKKTTKKKNKSKRKKKKQSKK